MQSTSLLLKGKYPSLDGLRAVSISFVLFSHLNKKFELFSAEAKAQVAVNDFVKQGNLGVHVFFVISGFLITSLLLREQEQTGAVSLTGFYVRRFLRILPVALLYIAVLLVLNQLVHLQVKTATFLHLLTFTENFDPNYNWYAGHYWSLSIEEQFYLLFPALFKWSRKVYKNTALFLLILSPAVRISNTHFAADFSEAVKSGLIYLDNFLNAGMVSILVGSFTAIVLFGKRFAIRRQTGATVLQVVLMSVIILVHYHLPEPFAGIQQWLSALLIAVFLVSTLVYRHNFIFRFLNHPFVMRIGVLSYSLYIWQQLFSNRASWGAWGSHPFLFVFQLVAIGAVAYLSYAFFESPFLKLKGKLHSKKAAQPSAEIA